MDLIDEKILDALKTNGKATACDISKKVNLSIPAVAERIRKLDKAGIIEQYTIKVNRKKAGYGLLAIVFVNIESTENIDDFRKAVVRFREVIECYHVAGEYDYMLKVLMNDTEELESFLSKKLKHIKGVQQI